MSSIRTRLTTSVVAMLVLVAIVALGPAGSSAAPAAATAAPENAVIYWSGVASNAIVVGRAPAASAVLGGMVHGAMYDAVAAIDGKLKPFATRVTAPPDASADAAVAQAARDVLVARIPGQAATVQAAYDAYMAGIPAGRRRTGASWSASPQRPGCWRCGAAITSTTSFPTCRNRQGRACSSRSADPARRCQGWHSCGHSRRLAVGLPAGTPVS